MNLNQKGWLKEYLDFRKQEFANGYNVYDTKKGRHSGESLYSILQPTGLMYGQPIIVGDQSSDGEFWDNRDRLKVLLAESFINTVLLFHTKEINSVEQFSEIILKTASRIGRFYNEIYLELTIPTKTFFGKKKSPISIAEIILQKRIDQNISVEQGFWSNFFHNSLLFLDIFFFAQWTDMDSKNIDVNSFKQQEEELRFCVVKVLVAAAYANGTVEKEERKLFEYFINSSGLNEVKKKEAYSLLAYGVSLEDLVLSSANSWILKKYFFELAILTVWVDKQMEDSEIAFLKEFRKKINLPEEDFDNSMMAIEGFVLQYWEELDALQGKKDYHALRNQFIGRMSKIVSKNYNKIARKIKENKKFHALLDKLNHKGLEDRDREQFKLLLIHMLKSIPSFMIISLPSKFLTLPVLLKILPQDLIK